MADLRDEALVRQATQCFSDGGLADLELPREPRLDLLAHVLGHRQLGPVDIKEARAVGHRQPFSRMMRAF